MPHRITIKPLAIFAAAMTMAFSAPAHAGSVEVNHDYRINFDKDKSLLPDLIKMDADDIADMKAEFAKARSDIDDALKDIADARKEAKSAPLGGLFVKIALGAAGGAIEAADGSFDGAFEAIDRAERDLKTADVSADERVETQTAIDTLRDELTSLQVKLRELAKAMRA